MNLPMQKEQDEYYSECECCEHYLGPDTEVFKSEHEESQYEGMRLCPDCFESISKEYWNGVYNREPEINGDR